jgi:spore maturation protein CgeB
VKLVIFGLSVSSSWGNGHATLWRGLARALARRGHAVVFFEKDVPYYASHRDLTELPGGRLVLYGAWEAVRGLAEREVGSADAAVVTSFCPDGVAASELVLSSRVPAKVFYDLDTPVTLAALDRGEPPAYIGANGLRGFDLVLTFTGGAAVRSLRERLGAARVVPLFGHVDPDVHRPVGALPKYAASLSYLGTYSEDRQAKVEELFFAPARLSPGERFVLGGSLYPDTASFPSNVVHLPHVPPGDHAAFFSSSRITLNVTRNAMAKMGHCPSGRLFEAAACGVPIVSDDWEGLRDFFEPGREILVVASRGDVLGAMRASDEELLRMARAARERTLATHTALRRAVELEAALSELGSTPAREPARRAVRDEGRG